MNPIFEGTGVALVTPFQSDLSIDFSSFEKVINHTIAGGVDFLVVLGTTGEPATLSKQEKNELIRFCISKIDGRVPLVVGAGGNDTASVIKDIEALPDNGISGLLSVAPYYNKPTQRGIFEHFNAIAQSTTHPIIVYNVPARTGSNIMPETIVSLTEKHKNIVALKEASGDFSQLMQLMNKKPNGFNVLSGDDALTLPMVSLGVKGVISVVANSHPYEFSSLVKAALANDYTKAREFQYRLVNYINALFTEGSPAGIKASLEILGLCKKNVRLPLVPVSDEHYLRLQSLISSI